MGKTSTSHFVEWRTISVRPSSSHRPSRCAPLSEAGASRDRQSLGGRGRPGVLLDMREFVSYAPRMVTKGQVDVLYSGCQYEPREFRDHLDRHLSRLDEFFCKSIAWLGRKGYTEVHARILSGDFVLFEFDELRAYHPKAVGKRAWEIYCSACEGQGIDWRVYRPEPRTFRLDQNGQRNRYDEIVGQLGS